MTAARRAALRARLAAEGLDALLVTRMVNVRYLTGFTGSAGRVLLTAGGTGEAFATDGRYTAQAAAEVAGLELVETRGAGWVAERLGGGGRRLGLEGHDVAWATALALAEELEGVAVEPAGRHVEALRACKDDAELATLARAGAVGDAALGSVLGGLRPGLSERSVARMVEDALRDAGADGPAFATVVASGENGARPHHTPDDRVLRRGDLVTIDCGALVDGYHGDLTRTVALGEPGPRLRGLHALVLAAQRAGVGAAVDGATEGAVDAACREPIAAAGHGEHFVHPTGHALGLEIHEDPILRAGGAGTLSARMAVTVEPGVYVPGLGGVRIEDAVVIGPSGAPARALTSIPLDLLVL